MKRIFLVTVICLITISSMVMAEEEVRLTTILPFSNILRGSRGAVGAHYGNTANLPDSAIENGHFYIENGLDLGAMYDNADPSHGTYVNNSILAGMLRLGVWVNEGFGLPPGGGVMGGIYLGTAAIHSFERTRLHISHNLLGSGPATGQTIRLIGTGPGMVMNLGRESLTAVPGLHVYVIPDAPGGTIVTNNMRLDAFRGDQNRTTIRTFSGKTTSTSPGDGLWVDNIRVAAPSDISLKKDISNMPNVLARIDTIRGVNFKWKDESDASTQAGVIAQEVERSFPELVRTNPAGIKYVSYEGLTGALVEAVKELKKENEALKAQDGSIRVKIDSLKKENDLLKEDLERLEKEGV